ncbi:MAG: DNA-binding protein [Candidatus Binatia bacterium]|nr:MAG: DNA-binding protein [Candidatus Binatia bacterium]
MRAIEIEADTIDAAVAEGLRQLGVEQDRVQVAVLDPGARGVLGIGARKARVRIEVMAEAELPAAPEETTTPASAATEPPLAESIERARQALAEIFRLLEMPVEVQVTRSQDQIVFNIVGGVSGFIIGKRGQMLDALEYVVNRIAVRDEPAVQHITLDVEGYRERRRQYLEGLARRLGATVKRKRKPIELEPMSPRDRRVVHLTLQGDPALTTRSTGEGYYRRVVIAPKQSGRA